MCHVDVRIPLGRFVHGKIWPLLLTDWLPVVLGDWPLGLALDSWQKPQLVGLTWS